MTFAWYGHLRFKQGVISVIFITWLIAFLEYCFQVPANRLGYVRSADKDSLKNEVLKRNPLNKNLKDSLPEPKSLLGSGLKNRQRRIFQWILNNGRQLVHLQIACGHADITTTRSYCQTSQDEVLEAMRGW
jgi:hypothetical protein